MAQLSKDNMVALLAPLEADIQAVGAKFAIYLTNYRAVMQDEVGTNAAKTVAWQINGGPEVLADLLVTRLREVGCLLLLQRARCHTQPVGPTWPTQLAAKINTPL